MYTDLQHKGIGVDDLEETTRIAETLKSPFPFLADPGHTAYDAFGFGTIAYVLQKSGTVVVERGGRITMLHRALNPNRSLVRADLDAAVAALPAIR